MFLKSTLAFSLLIISVFGSVSAQEKQENAPVESPPPVEITLRLNKQEVVPGEKIVLDQIVPKRFHAGPRTIQFRALRIGVYDAGKGGLVNLERKFFSATLNKPFDDLPMLTFASYPMGVVDLSPTEKGLRHEFTAKRLGIFLITVTWGMSKEESIASVPVVLVVRPPVDAGGQPKILNPDWLHSDLELDFDLKKINSDEREKK